MLDFLLGNPILLFIVIALISTLFRKREQPAPAKRRESQGPHMPTFSNEEPLREQELQQERTFPEPRLEYEEPVEVVRKPEPVEVASKPEPVVQQVTMSMSSPQTNSYDRTRRVVSVPEKKAGLSADQARLGMMWAEVFGPPRAKRPYRR